MDSIIEFITSHAGHAHWLIFFLNLTCWLQSAHRPRLLLIISAVLAATVVPENTLALFFAVFLGALFSASIAYWIGRSLGPKLFRFPFFSRLLTPQRLENIKKFHEKFGLWSLIIGRFIPFGVRNCIFMSSGLSKMPFSRFILRDALACFLWSSVSFSILFFPRPKLRPPHKNS